MKRTRSFVFARSFCARTLSFGPNLGLASTSHVEDGGTKHLSPALSPSAPMYPKPTRRGRRIIFGGTFSQGRLADSPTAGLEDGTAFGVLPALAGMAGFWRFRRKPLILTAFNSFLQVFTSKKRYYESVPLRNAECGMNSKGRSRTSAWLGLAIGLVPRFNIQHSTLNAQRSTFKMERPTSKGGGEPRS
jgi:hypothetical protein